MSEQFEIIPLSRPTLGLCPWCKEPVNLEATMANPKDSNIYFHIDCYFEWESKNKKYSWHKD